MSQSLSLGRHFIVGLSSPTLSAAERIQLKELDPLGVILFAYNFEKNNPQWPTMTLQLRREIEVVLGRTIVFSIDHEGGSVHRLPPPATKFPSARHWANQAESVGSAMGAELRSLGFNLNFAPVLDVDSESNNPVIGVRAFSSNPAVVAEAAIAFMKGLRAKGILACGKHFPGHGATTADSHLTLPTVNDDLDTILNRDVLPFSALISAGLQMIMTAHVMYPALDPARPATVSSLILSELLRKRLGYMECVVSDALEMHALDYLSRTDLAEAALSAGVDILLLGQKRQGTALEDALVMKTELEASVANSTALQNALYSSRKRLNKLGKSLKTLEDIPKSIKEGGENLILGCDTHQNLLTCISSSMPK